MEATMVKLGRIYCEFEEMVGVVVINVMGKTIWLIFTVNLP
jgi:hypothetical protein